MSKELNYYTFQCCFSPAVDQTSVSNKTYQKADKDETSRFYHLALS